MQKVIAKMKGEKAATVRVRARWSKRNDVPSLISVVATWYSLQTMRFTNIGIWKRFAKWSNTRT